jgi:hypothetical protein
LLGIPAVIPGELVRVEAVDDPLDGASSDLHLRDAIPCS